MPKTKKEVNREREERLGVLFDTVLEDLISRIKSGEAQPSEKAAAIQLLKHNAITIDPMDRGKTGANASKLLSLVTDDELKEAAG